MDPKQLKRLAKACRAAGIKHYKSGEIEFTLGDEPIKPSKATKVSQSAVESEPELSDMDLLLWSAGAGDGAEQGN